MKRFYTFCTTYNVSTPFPLSEQSLCSFAAYLADQDLAPQTIKSYLSVLRNMQISLRLPDPREQSSLPVLKQVQAGIRRTKMLKGSPPRIRLPITVHIILLEQIRASLTASANPDKLTIWAVAASAFFGFFRLRELLPASASSFHPAKSLTWGDIATDGHTNPTMVQFHLKVSKCDQFGSGSDIVVGHTNTPLCPVSALLQYMEKRGDQPGAFFLDSAHSITAKPRFVARIRKILTSIAYPSTTSLATVSESERRQQQPALESRTQPYRR